MTHDGKIFLVISILYNKKDIDILASDINDGRKEVLSDHDVDIILEYLIDKSIVSFVPALDVDGNKLPIFRYRLTSEGLILIEKNANSNEKQLEIKSEKEEPNITNMQVNPYPRIFVNSDSYHFFECLRSNVRLKFQLADYSFIFRRMHKDTYIFENVLETEFRAFLLQNFSVDLAKLKLIDYCKTYQKEENYMLQKKAFKNLM